MAIQINGNGTITGISVGGLPNGIVDTDMLADGAATAVKRGAGSPLQVVQSSNDLASVSGITSTSFATSSSLPYVNITPIKANSLYRLEGKLYGAFNSNTQPVLGFCVSTDNGSSWTYNLQSKGTTQYSHGNGAYNYGEWMTWDDMPEFIVHWSTLYISSFAAGTSNIRFGICYRNIYHSSNQNAFTLSNTEDTMGSLLVTEIAT